jgi:hypothetical protein
MEYAATKACRPSSMKPINWLRKFAERGHRGYPVGTLAFYGPDDRFASKAVFGYIEIEGAEPILHKWLVDDAGKDLRYDVRRQREWIHLIEQQKIRSLGYTETIIGCPHEEGIDYSLGESCPQCPYWAGRRRPIIDDPR